MVLHARVCGTLLESRKTRKNALRSFEIAHNGLLACALVEVARTFFESRTTLHCALEERPHA